MNGREYSISANSRKLMDAKFNGFTVNLFYRITRQSLNKILRSIFGKEHKDTLKNWNLVNKLNNKEDVNHREALRH